MEVVDQAPIDELRRIERDAEEFTARMARQLEELIPAPPVDQLYQRSGTSPAGAEQFARFVEASKIPADSQ